MTWLTHGSVLLAVVVAGVFFAQTNEHDEVTIKLTFSISNGE